MMVIGGIIKWMDKDLYIINQANWPTVEIGATTNFRDLGSSTMNTQ